MTEPGDTAGGGGAPPPLSAEEQAKLAALLGKEDRG